MNPFHTEMMYPYEQAQIRQAAERHHILAARSRVVRPWRRRVGFGLVRLGQGLHDLGRRVESTRRDACAPAPNVAVAGRNQSTRS